MGPNLYHWLAVAVMTVHMLLVLFVVGGLALILAGNLKRRRWRWVNTLSFRLVHLATIALVVAESWFDIVCPLTSLEIWLRQKANLAAYEGGFIEHWIERLLYYEAPPWVFAALYTLFGTLVVAAWIWSPPVRPRRKN